MIFIHFLCFNKTLKRFTEMKTIENVEIVDNISEALYECIEEGSESFSMLICEINGSDGYKYQAHIIVTRNENDFIDNSEDMPVFNHGDDYRIVED